MKAVVITTPGGNEVLAIEQRPDPIPAPAEVRIRIHASALNRADLSQRLGRYPAPHGSPPDIPGLEYAGEIESVGSLVTMWQPGDRVMGIVGGGAHAELVCAHEREVIPAPRNLTMSQAAAIPEVFLTAFDAMEQLGLQAGETMLIHAAGSGVGTAAIQLARISSVRTIGTSRSADKIGRAAALGLDHGLVATDDSWSKRAIELTDGKGVHSIIDLVGAGYLQGNLEALRVRGRMISVGLTAGAKAELDMGLVMRKRLKIIGTVMRARGLEEKIRVARDFADRIVPFFDEGKLEPVVDSTLPFENIRDAHALMESNRNFGKIVLHWS